MDWPADLVTRCLQGDALLLYLFKKFGWNTENCHERFSRSLPTIEQEYKAKRTPVDDYFRLCKKLAEAGRKHIGCTEVLYETVAATLPADIRPAIRERKYPPGVKKVKNRFIARVTVDKKMLLLGTFRTVDEAAECAREYHETKCMTA